MFLTFFMFLLCSLLNISRVFWKRLLRYILPSQISPRHCYRTSTSAKWNTVHKSSCSVARDLKKTDKGEITFTKVNSEHCPENVRKNQWKNRWTKLTKWWKRWENIVFMSVSMLPPCLCSFPDPPRSWPRPSAPRPTPKRNAKVRSGTELTTRLW